MYGRMTSAINAQFIKFFRIEPKIFTQKNSIMLKCDFAVFVGMVTNTLVNCTDWASTMKYLRFVVCIIFHQADLGLASFQYLSISHEKHTTANFLKNLARNSNFHSFRRLEKYRVLVLNRPDLTLLFFLEFLFIYHGRREL